MTYNFFDFYNIYSKLYNKILFYDINADTDAEERIEKSGKTRASQKLIVNYIGRNTMSERNKVETAKKEFNKKYMFEILAYEEFMRNYKKLLPELIYYTLKNRGHDVALVPDAKLSFADFDRMVMAYRVNVKNNTKPYVLAHNMEKIMKPKNGYRFCADDLDKAEDYIFAFEKSCQYLYNQMLNFVTADYISSNSTPSSHHPSDSYVDSCLIGADIHKN